MIDVCQRLAQYFKLSYQRFLAGGGLQNGLRLYSHELIWIKPAEEKREQRGLR
jgi:hypothetical protein